MKLSLILAILAIGSGARSEEAPFQEMKLSGFIQLFEQVCSAETSCELPVAIGDKSAYQVVLPRPPSGSFSQENVQLWQEEVEVNVDFYWRMGDPLEFDQHYLVTQITLRKNGAIISRCSRYDGDTMAERAIVGACAGTLENGNLLGVSLQKY